MFWGGVVSNRANRANRANRTNRTNRSNRTNRTNRSNRANGSNRSYRSNGMGGKTWKLWKLWKLWKDGKDGKFGKVGDIFHNWLILNVLIFLVLYCFRCLLYCVRKRMCTFAGDLGGLGKKEVILVNMMISFKVRVGEDKGMREGRKC